MQVTLRSFLWAGAATAAAFCGPLVCGVVWLARRAERMGGSVFEAPPQVVADGGESGETDGQGLKPIGEGDAVVETEDVEDDGNVGDEMGGTVGRGDLE